jgi:membrane protein CcdC involved in cytochrome C biogenesis
VAKAIRRKEKRRRSLKDEVFPLSRENFIIIGIGLLVIVGGYIAMLEGSVEGFLPLVLAPILLVLGYCVIIPLGILYRKSYFESRDSERTQSSKTG